MKTSKGFTLIELMIVVAIIGILTAVAVPVYQEFTIRSQVSEGLSLAAGAKVAMSEYYEQRGNFPASNASLGLPIASEIDGTYVSSVDAGSAGGTGVVLVTYGNNVNSQVLGDTLEVSAVTSVGSIKWVCRSSSLPAKYLPTNCR
ncbi:pilin [Marinobacter halotolerans]|uniref:pilin n=1 Tax=Marinobacter halotolerans TaxID=1569211 RepID=UPI0012470316|nr:pilin [Marinobacter halotolerans]